MHRPLTLSLLAVSAALLPIQAIAQTARPCLTPREAQALISFALPDVLAGITTKCAPVAGATSYLAMGGKTLSEKYRPASALAWPSARPAIRKLAGPDAQFLDVLPDDALKGLSGTLAATAIVKEIKPEQCADADRLVRAVAPLPPENMSMLVGIMLEIISRPKAQAAVAKAKSPLNICPAPSGPAQPVTTK